MKNKSPAINLSKKKDSSFADKFINWSLTFGRVLVILTEGIALSAFIYRFSLDRQLIDLHDKIKNKQSIIKFLKNDEDKYRNLQSRLFVAKGLGDSGFNLFTTYTEIMSFAPDDSIFNNITVSEDNINLIASFKYLPSLTKFIDSLKNYPKIESINLSKIDSRTSSGTIEISLSITFKKNTPMALNKNN